MRVKIKRIDKALPLPEYKTPGAAALDLIVREDVIISSGAVKLIPMNVTLQLPAGHFTHLVARSSLYKRGLMLVNGAGILDPDYSGNDDEYLAPIYNFSDETVLVKRGERIVQIVVLPFERVVWEEASDLKSKNRGGFGTTG